MKRIFPILVLLLLPTLGHSQGLFSQRPKGMQTVAFSATPTFDAGQTDTFTIVLTGNVTSSTLVSAEPGQWLNFLICQDGTGGRTFQWPPQFNGPIAVASGANVCTLEIFKFNGTTAYIPSTASVTVAFGNLSSGTNTQAAMVIGTGASLATSGTGTIAATSSPFSGLTTGANTAATMTVGTGATISTSGSGVVNANQVTGTTVPSNGAADQTLLTTASAVGSWATIPGCLDSGGNHLNYNNSTHSFSCGNTGGTAGSTAFNNLTSGTNTQAAMLVGTGASLNVTGSGTIAATSAPFSGISGGTNTTAALVLGTGSSLTISGSGTNNANQISGTTVPVNSAADQFLGTTASATGAWASVPSCLDSGGNHLNYNTGTHAFSCGTSGGTAGSAAFNTITSGTNSSATMTVGTGASLTTSGSGSITATALPFSGLSSATNTTAAAVFGTGSSLTFSGSGTINASSANGTTVPTSSAADQFLGTTASGVGQWAAIPSCLDSGGNHLNYNTSTHTFTCGTSSSGGGGSGTVSNGTGGFFGWYGATGTTISANPRTDDGVTNANGLTYTGTAGIFAPVYNSTSSGAMTFIGTEGPCSGGAVGKDVLCIGDSTSHSIQANLNGAGFFPFAQHQSTSPVPHGLMVSETFPQMTALPRGVVGQAMLEGTSTADPGYGSLNLAGGANIVQGILPKLNHPTTTMFTDQVNTATAAGTLDFSASTVASALRVPNGAGLTTALNGGIGYDTTSNNFHGGVNSADSRIPVNTGTAPVNGNCVKWTNTSGHIELADQGAACGSGGTPRLDQVLSATSAWTTTNGDNPLSFQFAPTTAGRNSLEITESGAGTSTGVPHLFYVHTLSGSTSSPAVFCAGGTTICWGIASITGLWQPSGGATLATGGTAHSLPISEGSSPIANVTGSTGQLLTATTGADPAFADFFDVRYYPSAGCNTNTSTPFGVWSLWPSATSARYACRAGGNGDSVGFIDTLGTSQGVAQFQVEIPEDWDSGTNPWIRLQVSSNTTTSGQTIILQENTACYKGDGSTTDDVATNATRNFNTITTNTTANQFWSTANLQFNSTDMTGCVAGGLMTIFIGRGSDTAPGTTGGVRVFGATVTFPRRLVSQAN